MPLEIGSASTVCRKCGTTYGRLQGCFYTCYADLYKGNGYLPYCKNCVDNMYMEYYKETNDTKASVRQTCRKLDLYWNEKLFDVSELKSTTKTVMQRYLTSLKAPRYAGKSYDDFLKEEGTLWSFIETEEEDKDKAESLEEQTSDDLTNISPEVIEFWGKGYTADIYNDLEQRKKYWMSQFPEGFNFDIGTLPIIRQICGLEVDINRDRAAGKSVDKNINALNTLLGSASLKPIQQKDDAGSSLETTPLGVWLYRYEYSKPLPEVDDDLKDVNRIKKYFFTWLGHVCKMLGVKNTYTKLYEEEIERLRIEKPEYDSDDEEDLLIDAYSESGISE